MTKVATSGISLSIGVVAVVFVLVGLAADHALAGTEDEVLVTIRADCTVAPPEPVVINAPAGLSGSATGFTKVRWVIAADVRGVAKIVPKSDETQDAQDRGRGSRIKGLFLATGEQAVTVTRGSGVSRKPTRSWEAGFRNGEIRFHYSVEIPGVCSKDPQVCIRQQGSGGCST